MPLTAHNRRHQISSPPPESLKNCRTRKRLLYPPRPEKSRAARGKYRKVWAPVNRRSKCSTFYRYQSSAISFASAGVNCRLEPSDRAKSGAAAGERRHFDPPLVAETRNLLQLDRGAGLLELGLEVFGVLLAEGLFDGVR